MRMLVTLGGFELSEAILDTVAKLARPLNAEVELLTIANPDDTRGTLTNAATPELIPAGESGVRIRVPLPSDLMGPPAETRTQALSRVVASLEDYLASQAHRLEGINVETRIEFADEVADAVIERARQTHPDLIAMATHGRSGMSHLLMGSVSERVVRSGVAPVLVIRP